MEWGGVEVLQKNRTKWNGGVLRCYKRIVLSGMGGVEVLQKNRTKWNGGC